MAIPSWVVDGFIIPTLEISMLFGLIGLFLFFLIKGIRNAYSKAFKFTWKYKILRRKYPEKTIKWIMDCMDIGIGFYDAKKILKIKMYPENQINETLWIYDQMINEMKKKKGGVYDGRNHKGYNSKNAGAEELPIHTN
jgi:hypothetical protein